MQYKHQSTFNKVFNKGTYIKIDFLSRRIYSFWNLFTQGNHPCHCISWSGITWECLVLITKSHPPNVFEHMIILRWNSSYKRINLRGFSFLTKSKMLAEWVAYTLVWAVFDLERKLFPLHIFEVQNRALINREVYCMN